MCACELKAGLDRGLCVHGWHEVCHKKIGYKMISGLSVCATIKANHLLSWVAYVRNYRGHRFGSVG